MSSATSELARLSGPESQDQGADRARALTDDPRQRCVHHLIEEQTTRTPEAVAVAASDGTTLTYAQLDERSTRLANWMGERGVSPGDHVALLLYNGTEYVEGFLAAHKLRAAAVNVNYRYVEEELRYLLDDSDAVGAVVHRRFAGRLAAIRAELVARHGPVGAAIRILYGGSMKPAVAASLLGLPEVGGALVGGASLVAADFLAIAAAAPGALHPTLSNAGQGG